MTDLARLWLGLRAPVSRPGYALSGFGLMGLKYAVEALVVHEVSGRWLLPLDYLNPVLTARLSAVGGDASLAWFLVLWTLPFLWIGASMTLRRAEDAGISPFVVLLYFVPLVNYALMLGLCLLPSRPAAAGPPRSAPRLDEIRSSALGVGLGVVIALVMTYASVLVFGSYGTTLFVGTPFVMGAVAAFAFNAGGERSTRATLLVAALSVVFAGGAILVLALEGLLCLMMAAPPGLVLALMGALLGRAIALRGTGRAPGLALALLPLPFLPGLEAKMAVPAPIEVVSALEVAAPPDVVWRHVVSFSALPGPPSLPFRLGIAYPTRATIEGTGVGAVRRCEFSTGAFVEPITAWDEPRRLAFDVAAQPPALQEWSPYGAVAARHLDGYLAVSGGEFRLAPLPGGRTRLEGRTRYALRVFPAAYWRLWSDAIIHAIHGRVLAHVRALAETSPPR